MSRKMHGHVLITQGTRPFAQRVGKLLPDGPRVLFGSSDEVPDVLVQTGNYLQFPKAGSPAFVHRVLKICLDMEVETLLPLGANELYPMAEARQLFAEYGIDVWVPTIPQLAGLPVLENPPRQLPLMVLRNGTVLNRDGNSNRYDTLSGVFTPSDAGDELALCCIGD